MDDFKIIAVAVVYNDAGQLLLTKRSVKEDHEAGSYSYPGGKIEYSGVEFNIVEHNLQREIKEEVGIEVGNIRYLNSHSFEKASGEKVIVLAFVAKYLSGELMPQEAEIAEAIWVDMNTVERTVEIPGVLKVYKEGYKLITEQDNLVHLAVAGLVINDQGEFLLVRNIDKQAMDPGKLMFPMGKVNNIGGSTWEVLEKNLTKAIFKQTSIEIADGAIPFTDEAFVGKGGFDKIVQFFICRYKFGKPVNNDPNEISEVIWKRFTDFDRAEFDPLVYQVFEKASQFITKLTSR